MINLECLQHLIQGPCHATGARPVACLVSTWQWAAKPAPVQVFWVDLLTKEEFEAGFGSHTPMFTGQTKCVRYFMNFARGLAMLRSVALKVGRGTPAA